MTGAKLIGDYGIKSLFHFTDTRNLASISVHGLLSLAEQERRKIECPAPGGNEWSHDADKRAGVDDYVHLCFLRDHPMEYRARQDGRIASTTFLEIDSIVLTWDGVIFTPDVSNKSGVEMLSSEQASAELDFEILYKYFDWRIAKYRDRRLAARKYEVLVPTHIPLQYIRGIA